jgi:hypothetical protein
MADEESPNMLQQQQIPSLPPSMFYIPNFITEDEEQRILEKVNQTLSYYQPVSSNLTRSPDPRQPLDIPQTSPPASHLSPTHCEQHSSRLDKDATLAHDSRRRSDLFSGRL